MRETASKTEILRHCQTHSTYEFIQLKPSKWIILSWSWSRTPKTESSSEQTHQQALDSQEAQTSHDTLFIFIVPSLEFLGADVDMHKAFDLVMRNEAYQHKSFWAPIVSELARIGSRWANPSLSSPAATACLANPSQESWDKQVHPWNINTAPKSSMQRLAVGQRKSPASAQLSCRKLQW